MKAHSKILRTILLGAVSGGFWSCSSDIETCDSCTQASGDGDGDVSSMGDGDGDVSSMGDGDGDVSSMGDGDGDVSSMGDGDGDTALGTCTNPVEKGDPRGLVGCDEGYRHRPASLECPNNLPRDNVVEWPEFEVGQGGAGGAGGVPFTTSVDECSTDSDCGELEICYLRRTNVEQPCPPWYDPTYVSETPDYARRCSSIGTGCVTDADCDTNQYCECGEYRGVCADVNPVAGCRTDSDCEGEALCLDGARSSVDSFRRLACQLEGDECETDDDCDDDSFCSLSSESGRTCRERPVELMTVCGRPFLVLGATRLAPLERSRSSWPEDLETAALPEEEILRRDLASHFSNVGLMEHASIAAFARFTLQLLSLGAPAEFVEASNCAQVDETRHARLAFALASVYAGESVGPGALSLDGAFEETSWEAIFQATVREGCIGETRAALEAKWAAESCLDPVVRAVLEEIAHDETEHAELAWRVAAWMIGERPELAGSVARIFGEAEKLPVNDPVRPAESSCWGVLSNDELRACWKDAWDEVIEPCARVLHEVAVGFETRAARPSRSDPQRSGGHTAPRA